MPFPVKVPLHALGLAVNCSQWNVDFHVHFKPILFKILNHAKMSLVSCKVTFTVQILWSHSLSDNNGTEDIWSITGPENK